MNTTIQNPVAAVASAMNPAVVMTPPVTVRDIAAALHMNPNTVRVYLGDNTMTRKYPSAPSVLRVREYAQKVGYDPKAAETYAHTNHSAAVKHAKEKKMVTYYFNGNFQTKAEEVQRMMELRAEGYSNAEIAKKIGRSIYTVRNNIGKQDYELWRQNVTMAHHIRAQKNAARKQYVINKPIREYNRRVEQHNKMKAELNKLQTELLTEKPAIVQAAQTKIDFPMIDLHTVQPTALQ